MENLNDIVEQLVADIDIPEDVPVSYEVWAVGYDEENELTGAALVLGTFNDPDQAVSFAKNITLATVANLAAYDDYDDLMHECHSISIEVETVVPTDDEEELSMNVGTVYKKRIELFVELPEFVVLANDEYVLQEDGNIIIPCNMLKDHKENDRIMVIYEEVDDPCPIEYKIISKTADRYICEFV